MVSITDHRCITEIVHTNTTNNECTWFRWHLCSYTHRRDRQSVRERQKNPLCYRISHRKACTHARTHCKYLIDTDNCHWHKIYRWHVQYLTDTGNTSMTQGISHWSMKDPTDMQKISPPQEKLTANWEDRTNTWTIWHRERKNSLTNGKQRSFISKGNAIWPPWSPTIQTSISKWKSYLDRCLWLSLIFLLGIRTCFFCLTSNVLTPPQKRTEQSSIYDLNK